MQPATRDILLNYIGPELINSSNTSNLLEIDQPAFSSSELAALISTKSSKRARPEQGGERISLEFLDSMPRRECLYWFRYILIS